MPLGKCFRLRTATSCLETVAGRRRAIQVPEGAIVKVLSGPRSDDRRMIEVLWGNKSLILFAEDLQARGDEVLEAHFGA